MNSKYANIGPTAVDVAISRAIYTDIPYSKEIAKELSTYKELVPLPVRKVMYKIFPSLLHKKSILEIRYTSTNDALSGLENPSILEIAAGLSPRSLEFADGSAIYVETDIEKMILQKKDMVKNIRQNEGKSMDSNHYFLPLNICNRKDLIRAGELISANDGDDPVAVIHEGLFEYLSSEEQKIARDNIAFFLEKYSNGGAWLTPDLSFNLDDDSLLTKWENSLQTQLYYIARKRIKGIESPTNFFSEGDVQNFLAEGGLIGERKENKHLIKNLTCFKKGLSKELANEFAPKYQAYIITLD